MPLDARLRDSSFEAPWQGQSGKDESSQNPENAAWFYTDPKSAAANIKDHAAFWKGVTVER